MATRFDEDEGEEAAATSKYMRRSKIKFMVIDN